MSEGMVTVKSDGDVSNTGITVDGKGLCVESFSVPEFSHKTGTLKIHANIYVGLMDIEVPYDQLHVHDISLHAPCRNLRDAMARNNYDIVGDGHDQCIVIPLRILKGIIDTLEVSDGRRTDSRNHQCKGCDCSPEVRSDEDAQPGATDGG